MDLAQTQRVGIIFGASSPVGRAAAQALSSQGVDLALVGPDAVSMDALARDVRANGGMIQCYELEVTRDQIARSTITKIADDFGRIDALLNLGQISAEVSMENTSGAIERELFEVNVLSTMATAHACLPVMIDQGGGHIVTVCTSTAYDTHSPEYSALEATRSAVRSYSDSINTFYGRRGVRSTVVAVNAMNPDDMRAASDQSVGGALRSASEPWRVQADTVADAIIYALTQPRQVSIREIRVDLETRTN